MEPVICLTCSGAGSVPCDSCDGVGHTRGLFGFIGRRPCTSCQGRGTVECIDCGGSGRDTSPTAGLKSADLETQRATIRSLGTSDDMNAFLSLRLFRDSAAAELLDPVRDEVQAALGSIRKRARRKAPRIRVGMSVADLVGLLGPPHSTDTGASILGQYGQVLGSTAAVSALSSSGYWMFRHPAGDFGVVVSGGAVEKVYDFPYV